jgi:hypothetical protein
VGRELAGVGWGNGLGTEFWFRNLSHAKFCTFKVSEFFVVGVVVFLLLDVFLSFLLHIG